MTELVVGIDVSKDLSTAQGLDSKGEKIFYLDFAMDADGFTKLHKTITSKCTDMTGVLIGMESTGCYHLNLFSFLIHKEIKCIVINPLLIANFAKLSLRKTKTDKKDAKTIAQFVLIHKDSLLKTEHSGVLQDMKDLARERESITTFIAGIKNDIRRMLQITFPELESFANIFSQTMMIFLKKYPSARTVRESKPKAIMKALTHKDGRKKPPFSSSELIEIAKRSVASHSIAKELILPEKIATLEHLIAREKKVAKVLVELCQQVMIEDIEIIKSLGGIRDTTASSFLAEVGNIDRFNSYKKLIAFAGLDPSIHQSGMFERAGKISKRGNRHLRHIIYTMTFCIVRNDNVFRQYFLKKRTEGQPYKKAVIATSHKLIRVIYSMLLSKSFYRKEMMHNS